MNRDPAVIDATLDDLLIRWWDWRKPMQPARGFNNCSMGTEGYRTSRQYDDVNGALDSDAEHRTMKLVSRAVDALENDHKRIIIVVAKALHMGIFVFKSPNLSHDPETRNAQIKAARLALVNILVISGVM